MAEAHSPEAHAPRRSVGGIFSNMLNKQTSLDTDTSDRKKGGFGAKVKPGGKHLLARTSSSSGNGDVHIPPESPSASVLSGNSPSMDWIAAGQEAATAHKWAGASPQLNTTPKARGIFSALLGKKKKKKGTHSPAGNNSPSLGASSRGSESPSSHLMEASSAVVDAEAQLLTPPCKSRSGSHDSDTGFDSVYSTPLNSAPMHSPTLQYPGSYCGDTLDLNQVMRQENPGLFTPSLNQLLDTAGTDMHEPDTPLPAAAEDPTVMLVSGVQLAQAGYMYDMPAMLLDAQPEESNSRAAVAPSPISDGNSTADEAESRPAAVQQGDAGSQSLAAAAPSGAPVIDHSRAAAVMQQEPQPAAVSPEEVQVGIHDTKALSAEAETGAAAQEAAETLATASEPAAPAEHLPEAEPAAPVDLSSPAAEPTAATAEPALPAEHSAAATAASEAPPAARDSDASAIASEEQSSEPASTSETEESKETSEASESEEQPSSPGLQADTQASDCTAAADVQQSAKAPSAAWPELEASALDAPAVLGVTAASHQVSEQAARSLEAIEERSIAAAAGDLSVDTAVQVLISPEVSELLVTSIPGPAAEQHAADTAAEMPGIQRSHVETGSAADTTTPPATEVSAIGASAELATEPGSTPLAAIAEPAAEGSAQPDQETAQDIETDTEAPAAALQEQQAEVLGQEAQEPSSEAAAELPVPASTAAAAAAESPVRQQASQGMPAQPAGVAASMQEADKEAAEEQSLSAVQAAGTAAEQQHIAEQPVPAEPSTASLAPVAEESSSPALAEEASDSGNEVGPAVALRIPEADDHAADAEPQQEVHTTLAPTAEAVAPTPLSSDSPVKQPAVPSPLRSSSARRSRQSPMNLVRESMPLFLTDPSRAMGSPVALEDEGLDDQDMQQIYSRPVQPAAASNRSSLLAHGGPQRVAVGQLGGFASSLEPVAESSFNSAGSPIPEESPSFAGSDGSNRSNTRLDLEGDMSPLRPRQLTSSPHMDTVAQATPAAGFVGARSPILGATPGSVYSTPTLAFNGNGAFGQAASSPQTGLTSVSVGSAIRQVTPGPVGVLDLSPAIIDMPESSPTLMLMPGGPGLNDTPVNMQGGTGDGTTPSLLDARAASPSAVYATRFMATPFRGALAALPMDAALAAPLVDSSPFQLSETGLDTVCLADEAQRVAANLAMAAGGFAATPVRTPAVNIPPSASPGSVASQGRAPAAAGSPTEELRDLHVVMLTKQLAEVQKKARDLEAENLRLKEQVEIYEFEKTELNSQEEMEKQARQYAEEQLEDMRVEMQKLMHANNAQSQQMANLQQEYQSRHRDAQMQYEALSQEHAQLAHTVAQLQDERNQVLDKLNLVDMQVTALKSSNADLSAAVEAEQQRCAELEAALAARDRDLAEAGRCSIESQARLEKMMEQMIAANTAKEHARQKANDESARVAQLLAERQQVLAQQGVFEEQRKKYAALKQRYNEKSGQVKEFEQKLQAREAENQELMTMCDQLLQQQEARRQ